MRGHERRVLEGLLFLSGDEGLSIEQLNGYVEELDKKEIEVVLDELMQDYLADMHGIELVHSGGTYKFVSKEAIHPYTQKPLSSTKVATLSNAVLETLAIIVYKQPTIRAEIEEIRGASYDTMVRRLLARNLIKECGRSDTLGRPFLYEVTEEFMDTFKLASLEGLPELLDFKDTTEKELFEEQFLFIWWRYDAKK